MPDWTEASMTNHATRFLDRTLPKQEWSHAGHFAAALWLIRHRPALTAPDEIRVLITRYNEATGTPNTETSGYHHTITLASLRAAKAHLEACGPDAALPFVLNTLLGSPLGDPAWLLAYWRRETVFSVEARRDWVAPDRERVHPDRVRLNPL